MPKPPAPAVDAMLASAMATATEDKRLFNLTMIPLTPDCVNYRFSLVLKI
jgi:hypothetical protein